MRTSFTFVHKICHHKYLILTIESVFTWWIMMSLTSSLAKTSFQLTAQRLLTVKRTNMFRFRCAARQGRGVVSSSTNLDSGQVTALPGRRGSLTAGSAGRPSTCGEERVWRDAQEVPAARSWAACSFTRLESPAWSQQVFWQHSFCRKRNLWSLCFDGGTSAALLFIAFLKEREYVNMLPLM